MADGATSGTRSAAAERFGGLVRGLGVLGFVWLVLQVAYFFRANPVLWLPEHGRRLGIFSDLLTTDWSFSLRHSPPLLLLGAAFVVALNVLLGCWTIEALDVPLSRRVRALVGLPVGLTVSGIAFELIAMAGLLKTPVVWIVWIVLLGVAFGARRWRHGRAPWRWWRRPAADDLDPAIDTPTARPAIRRGAPLLEELIPLTFSERWLWRAGAVLLTLVTIATFWHALFYPETYWDSLILYLGYGRMTFLQGAFPFKAVAQVGIGLGANYPHLFSTYGATASALFGDWSDLHQRLLAPLAILAAVLLVYQTVLLAWGRPLVAMACALTLRAVPYVTAYSEWASDYAIAILFTAAFLYALASFARTRLPGAFAVATLLGAGAMHINFLMGILGVPWLVALWSATRARRASAVVLEEEMRMPAPTDLGDRFPSVEDVQAAEHAAEAEAPPTTLDLEAGDPRGLWRVVGSRAFWSIVVVCVALSSTWYVRNWVLTGNPVYAFFPNIFTRSININTDVLRSAEIEWFRNGDGIGRIAEQYHDIAAERPMRDQYADGFKREATVRDRVAASFLYWQGFETFRERKDGSLARGWPPDRLAHLAQVRQLEPPPDGSTGDVRMLYNQHAYKMQPLVLGLALPGVLLGLLLLAGHRAAASERLGSLGAPVLETVLLSSAALIVALLAFHYLLADLYLYQIIPIVIPLAIVASGLPLAWTAPRSFVERVLATAGFAAILIVGLVPGLAMAMMGFKVTSGGVIDGQRFDPARLDIFRHPGMHEEIVYRLRFGDDWEMWDRVNALAKGTPLLTHDNRHLMYDPSIELVHLDDWDMQALYTISSPDERVALLRQRGIVYYLRVPNEFAHPINSRAGVQELIDRGDFVLVAKFGANELYRLTAR